MDLERRPVTQALAWPEVDGIVHPADLPVGHVPEVRALREVLAKEPVGVLVGAPLPGVVGQGEVCQDFGHYAARYFSFSSIASILPWNSAMRPAGCLWPMDECGHDLLRNPSIQSIQASLAASRVSDALRWHASFFRLVHRLSATALSRQQPVRPTERRTSLAEAHAASRAPVCCEPRSERDTAPPAAWRPRCSRPRRARTPKELGGHA